MPNQNQATEMERRLDFTKFPQHSGISHECGTPAIRVIGECQKTRTVESQTTHLTNKTATYIIHATFTTTRRHISMADTQRRQKPTEQVNIEADRVRQDIGGGCPTNFSYANLICKSRKSAATQPFGTHATHKQPQQWRLRQFLLQQRHLLFGCNEHEKERKQIQNQKKSK